MEIKKDVGMSVKVRVRLIDKSKVPESVTSHELIMMINHELFSLDYDSGWVDE